MTNISTNIQLFVYDTNTVMPIAMLFVLQGVYQLYNAMKQNKLIQFYLFITII
jgi:hypothetical protein